MERGSRATVMRWRAAPPFLQTAGRGWRHARAITAANRKGVRNSGATHARAQVEDWGKGIRLCHGARGKASSPGCFFSSGISRATCCAGTWNLTPFSRNSSASVEGRGKGKDAPALHHVETPPRHHVVPAQLHFLSVLLIKLRRTLVFALREGVGRVPCSAWPRLRRESVKEWPIPSGGEGEDICGRLGSEDAVFPLLPCWRAGLSRSRRSGTNPPLPLIVCLLWENGE